jgi:transcriptional regulator with XRE-family HTH domain
VSFASNRAASVRRTSAQVREEYLCQTWVETFWEELDAKCAALGWTLSTACRAAGLDPDYLGALRRDGGIPTPLHLRLITKALGANYPGWLNLLYTTPDDWPDVEAKPAGAAISMAEPSQSPDQPSAELWPVEQLRLWGADAADPASVGPPQSGATQGGPDFPGRETNLIQPTGSQSPDCSGLVLRMSSIPIWWPLFRMAPCTREPGIPQVASPI